MQFSSLKTGERFVCLIALLLSCLLFMFDCSCIFFFLILCDFCVYFCELEGLFIWSSCESVHVLHLTGPLRQWAAFAIAQVVAAHAQNTCDLCEVPCRTVQSHAKVSAVKLILDHKSFNTSWVSIQQPPVLLYYAIDAQNKSIIRHHYMYILKH